MKHGIIYYKDTYNIGDDIQTLAAQSLLPDAEILDRENLDNYSGEDIKLLCNGYFMTNPEHWPPDPKIHPFFISFHISAYRQCEKFLLNPRLKEYYQAFGPIGCRDKSTMRRLHRIGVDAYFSACITLTLERNPDVKRENKILFVDPFLKMKNPSYQNYMIRNMVPDKWIDRVEVISHDDMKISGRSKQERLANASALLDKFAAASIVFTSRIHCALPCIAIGTPVYFMDLGYDRPVARKRFDGILDFMDVLTQKDFPLSSNMPHIKIMRRLGLYKLFPKKRIARHLDWELKPNERELIGFYKSDIKKRIEQHFS